MRGPAPGTRSKARIEVSNERKKAIRWAETAITRYMMMGPGGALCEANG